MVKYCIQKSNIRYKDYTNKTRKCIDYNIGGNVQLYKLNIQLNKRRFKNFAPKFISTFTIVCKNAN